MAFRSGAYQTLSLEDGLTLKQIDFSRDGLWLTAYAISKIDGPDQCHFWEMSELKLSDRGYRSYDKVIESLPSAKYT